MPPSCFPPALSVLYGDSTVILLHILHHADGLRLPTDMPVGVVDQDMSATSRQLIRNLDAFEQTAVVARYPTINEARTAMQRGEIYGFFYIPKVPLPKRRPDAAQTLFLYKQYPAHRRFTPLQGHEDDERIGIRCRST